VLVVYACHAQIHIHPAGYRSLVSVSICSRLASTSYDRRTGLSCILSPMLASESLSLHYRTLICVLMGAHTVGLQILTKDDDVRCGALADLEAVRERVGGCGGRVRFCTWL
jgi:hypothetical protein